MLIKNSEQQYGVIAIILHWVIAILIIGLLVLGIYMTRIPISATKLKLFGWHKEYGMLVLMLVAVRIIWRLHTITPTLAELPRWEQIAARFVHFLFYVFMLAVPISGWLLTSAAGLPVSFFGWFVLPDFISANEESRLLYTFIHKWLAYGLILLICLHTAAALKHHFINKDNILRRMI